MKKIFTLTIATLFVLIANYGNAADYTITDICHVQISGGGSKGLLYPCTTWVSVSGCANGWIAWEINTNEGKILYASALAAMLNNKSVVVRIDPNDACVGNYDKTSMIRVSR